MFADNVTQGQQFGNPCLSEANIQLVVSSVSALHNTVLSDPVYIRDLPW